MPMPPQHQDQPNAVVPASRPSWVTWGWILILLCILGRLATMPPLAVVILVAIVLSPTVFIALDATRSTEFTAEGITLKDPLNQKHIPWQRIRTVRLYHNPNTDFRYVQLLYLSRFGLIQSIKVESSQTAFKNSVKAILHYALSYRLNIHFARRSGDLNSKKYHVMPFSLKFIHQVFQG